jgi:hypothetical protein
MNLLESGAPRVDATALAEAAAGAMDGGVAQDAPAEAADAFDGFTCDPSKSPHDEGCVVDEAYAVFVAPAARGGSDTAGDGSRAKPYATLGHALGALAGKARVYVCNAQYVEQVSLSSAASLYGGFACPGDDAGAAWRYLGGQAQVSGPANQIPLIVSGVEGGVSIEDIRFGAPDASGHDVAGNGLSSIAVLVNASTLTLRRCALVAGSGDQGQDGAQGVNYSATGATPGGVNDGGSSGAAGGVVQCSDGTNSTGGNGGDSTATTGGDGGTGSAAPMPQTQPSMRLDGLGGTGGYACTPGDKGAYGAADEAGAPATTPGTLSASGWTPSGGSDGRSGTPGQGGGGGGGLAGSLPLGGTGGGAGGCGGAGGTGGKGGGASIALACFASTVILDTCTLATSQGGNGGNGGNGQPGQGGAAAGTASGNGNCAGGVGGNGAGGSAGAGGTGGISVCIVFSGSAPQGTPSCTHGDAGQPGTGGTGGAGGSNNLLNNGGPTGADAGAGTPGMATDMWQAQ